MVGTVYLVVHLLGPLSGPLWQIVNEIQDLQTAGASVARVQELLGTTSQIRDTRQVDTRQGDTRHEIRDSGALAVQFDDVSACMPDAH